MPAVAYVCAVLVALPVNLVEFPSPKFTAIDVIVFPVDGVAATVKVTAAPAVGDVVELAIVTTSGGFAPTTSTVEAEPLAPDESVAIAVTTYWPAAV